MTTSNLAEPFSFPMTGPQRAAAEPLEGKFIVIGGPGSGRTRVLIGRMRHLIDLGEPHGSITCLTASPGNALEIRRQLNVLTSYRSIEVCTIQEHARHLLREVGGAASAAGLSPRYTVLDDQQTRQVIRELARSSPGMGMLSPREMDRFLYWRRLNLARHRDEQLPPDHAAWLPLKDQYAGEKGRQNVVDEEDFVPLSIVAMERRPDGFLLWNSMSHRHLLVDDYEEITPAMYRLIELMSRHSKSVAVAADPNGGIGLNPGYERDLLELFRLDHRDARVIQLNLNHRSRGGLVTMAEAMSGHPDMGGLAAVLQTPIRPEGPRPRAQVYRGTQREMDRSVIATLEESHDAGHAWEEMALLSRRPSTLMRYLTPLCNRGIPHTVLGESHRPRSVQARVIVAMLRCLVNPADQIAFAVAMSDRDTWTPLREKTCSGAARVARTERITLVEAAGRYLPEIEQETHRLDLRRALEAYHSLDGMLSSPDTLPFDICKQAQALLHPNAKWGLPPPPEAETTRLLHLSETFRKYAREDPRSTLVRFLDLISFAPYLDRDIAESEATGGITLSTISAAKGLQWKLVWFVDATDHVIPGRVSENPQAAVPTLEEEQRRFYLASTRAMDYLCYCSVDNSGLGHASRPTRFLDAIAQSMEYRTLDHKDMA